MVSLLQTITKYGLLAFGWFFVGLAIIGAVLPVLPTTIFLIIAIACFARSSPRFEQWILSHPTFGPPLSLWREQGAISTKAKVTAVCMILLSLGLILWTNTLPLWGDVAVATVLASVVLYLITRPQPTQP